MLQISGCQYQLRCIMQHSWNVLGFPCPNNKFDEINGYRFIWVWAWNNHHKIYLLQCHISWELTTFAINNFYIWILAQTKEVLWLINTEVAINILLLNSCFLLVANVKQHLHSLHVSYPSNIIVFILTISRTLCRCLMEVPVSLSLLW